MPETIKIKAEAFKKNSDGSWTSVQNTDIEAPIGVIRISSGMTFKKGGTMLGIDIVSLLEQSST